MGAPPETTPLALHEHSFPPVKRTFDRLVKLRELLDVDDIDMADVRSMVGDSIEDLSDALGDGAE